MQLTYLHIHNFKSIRDMEIRDIDRALILVGKNNTGKTSILDAVCAVCGCYQVQEADFNEREQAIRIDASFSISSEDLALFHRMGIVSQYRRYEVWRRVFGERLPSFSQGELCFTFHVNKDGKVRYEDISSCSRKTGSSESSAPAPVSSILPRPAATASAVSASSTRKSPRSSLPWRLPGSWNIRSIS